MVITYLTAQENDNVEIYEICLLNQETMKISSIYVYVHEKRISFLLPNQGIDSEDKAEKNTCKSTLFVSEDKAEKNTICERRVSEETP